MVGGSIAIDVASNASNRPVCDVGSINTRVDVHREWIEGIVGTSLTPDAGMAPSPDVDGGAVLADGGSTVAPGDDEGGGCAAGSTGRTCLGAIVVVLMVMWRRRRRESALA